MNISIDEQSFSWRSEYDISVGGVQYSAQRRIFVFGKKLDLLSHDGKTIAKIRSKFSLFRPQYVFEFADGRIYEFRCDKLWNGVFICTGNEGELVLYEHKGLQWSIFQDERQIAAFTKNRITFGNGNKYNID